MQQCSERGRKNIIEAENPPTPNTHLRQRSARSYLYRRGAAGRQPRHRRLHVGAAVLRRDGGRQSGGRGGGGRSTAAAMNVSLFKRIEAEAKDEMAVLLLLMLGSPAAPRRHPHRPPDEEGRRRGHQVFAQDAGHQATHVQAACARRDGAVGACAAAAAAGVGNGSRRQAGVKGTVGSSTRERRPVQHRLQQCSAGSAHLSPAGRAMR